MRLRRPRLPRARHGAVVAPRPDDRDGTRRRPRPREPDPRGPAGAHAWQAGDRPTAVNRLRAAFELLTQARERFYPVDAYLIDICLLDPAMPARRAGRRPGGAGPGDVPRPGPADREPRPSATPNALVALREAITEGWADVVGGAYAEVGRAAAADRVDPLAVPPRGRGLPGHTSTTGTSRRSPGAGSGSILSCRRSPSGSGSGSPCTSASTPAGSRSVPSRSGSGRAPTARSLETLTRPPLAADRPAPACGSPGGSP